MLVLVLLAALVEAPKREVVGFGAVLPNKDDVCWVEEGAEEKRLPVVLVVLVAVKGALVAVDVDAVLPPKRPPDAGVVVLLLEPPKKLFVCCAAGCG